MITTILKHNHFKWIDVVLPTQEELQELATTYAIHLTSIRDCLQPNHLPKYEKIADVTFLIARGYDEKASLHASNVLDLTRKVAIFKGTDFLITVHRVDLDYLATVREKWQAISPDTVQHLQFQILCDILQAILSSYESPLDMAEAMLDDIENKIFMRKGRIIHQSFQEVYLLRRKVLIYQRMLHLALDMLAKLNISSDIERNAPFLQDIKDDTLRLLFISEQICENVNYLINLHLSLMSNRTNEVMRVLTVFSVFFMPITFIVGVYGMNFEHMPELKWQHGYFDVWLVILSVSLGLWIWFKRKGFL